MLDNDKGPMMRASDEAMRVLLDTLAAEIGPNLELEFDLGELVGKYRARYRREVSARMLEDDAYRLLHKGAEAIAERQGCHRVTVYRRAVRGRERAIA